MKERALIVIKPDAIIDGREAEIKDYLYKKRMHILLEKNLWISAEKLSAFYQIGVPKDSFAKMVALYSKAYATVLIFEGDAAIAIGQEAKSFFRKKYDYGYYGCTIHAADSASECEREAKCLLGRDYTAGDIKSRPLLL